MLELQLFNILKQSILLKYKESFPYYQGELSDFGNKEIENLRDLIEQQLNQSISEKWVYTHLKPIENEKLPRKDMLDILSQFVGYSNWDEFVYKNQNHDKTEVKQEKKNNRYLIALLIGLSIIGLGISGIYLFQQKQSKTQQIKLQNEFTQKAINPKDVKVYTVKDNEKIPVEVKQSQVAVEVQDDTKVVIESPYYKEKTITINKQNVVEKPQSVMIEPDDSAMKLKAFIQTNNQDWQKKKQQLNRILSDDLEVIIMLKNDLGAESFTKQEFINMTIAPTDNMKKLKIIDIQSDKNQKITQIRLLQE